MVEQTMSNNLYKKNNVTADSRLPGDPDKNALVQSMIRVNQAGEYGAKRIYQGQLAILGSSDAAPIIKDMLAQEEKHLDYFNTLVAERDIRPTVFEPLWHVAGYALGAATAALGRDATMACTVAVEDVICEHYTEQTMQLGEDEKGLRESIFDFCEDETHHRDISLKNGAENAPAYKALTTAVKAGTRLAIWLSKRF